MREVILPSGAKLGIGLAPFADAKDLYQSILRVLGSTSYSTKSELAAAIKDVFCGAFSSKEVETHLETCFKKCTYNGMKITGDTFEPVEAREDYIKVCAEVGMENCLPFFKSLFAEFAKATTMLGSTPL